MISEGSLDGIFERIPHSNFTDEDRFIKLLNESIERREIPLFPYWTKESKSMKVRARRKKQGEQEAQEAERAARELGIYDDLFAKNSKTEGSGNDSDNEEKDLSVLKALIQGRKRKAEDFLDNLAAKYSEQPRAGRGRKKAKGK